MNTKVLHVFGLIALLCAGVARAQPGKVYNSSLEAMMAKSQSVFRGAISNYSRTMVTAPWTKENWSGPHNGPQDGSYGYSINVRIDEVLKGPRRKMVDLTVDMDDFDREVEQWASNRTSLLFFVDAGTNRSKGTKGILRLRNIIRLGEEVPAERVINTALVVKPPVLLMDWTELTNSSDILARARAFAKQRGVSTNTFEDDLGTFVLEVPVTAELEKIALNFVSPSNNWGRRAEGVNELSHFKSSKNIKLLKSLLADTNSYETAWQDEPWTIKRVYQPRASAYQVLKSWGVETAPTVAEEPLPWHYDFSTRQELQVAYANKLSVWRAENDPDRKRSSLTVTPDYQGLSWTNLTAGSNTITGVKFELYVYPDGQTRPASPTRILRSLAKTDRPWEVLVQNEGGIPEPEKKYTVEMVFNVFETDNPPRDAEGIPGGRPKEWFPEVSNNYHVLFQKTVKCDRQ